VNYYTFLVGPACINIEDINIQVAGDADKITTLVPASAGNRTPQEITLTCSMFIYSQLSALNLL